MTAEEIVEGLIVRIRGADFVAESGGAEVRCALRGRMRLSESPGEVLPVVGDRIRFRRESGGASGFVTEILPRRSLLARVDPSQRFGYRVICANMDFAVLVFSVREPRLNERMLDRMLVAAERGGIEPVICVNKIDIAEDRAALDRALHPYRGMGYRLILSSAVTGEGVGELAALLAGRLSILAGPSGAGKTSLISRVQPGLELAIGDVSAKTGKGKHTTSHFELHRLREGGYLGDTPGVREFGVWDVSKAVLPSLFRDFAPFRGECRFASCTHSHEPDCAIKEAVASGGISRERYESYLRMLETIPQR